MEKLKATEALERRIDKILQDRADAIKKLEDLTKAEAETARQAQAAMDAATAAEDAKGYSKAKQTKIEADDAKEMYELRLDNLRTGQLMTKAEYDQAVKEIEDEMASVEQRKRDQLADLSGKMNDLAQELEDATKRANAALRRLQHEVYLDKDRSIGPNGQTLFLDYEAKSVKDTTATIKWGRAAAEEQRMQKALGRA